MNHKWLKRSVGTFDDGFFAFYQIQDIHTVVRMVCHRFGKPVAAGFDKLIFMQTSTFFYPAFAFGTRFEMVDQLVAYKLRLPFPRKSLSDGWPNAV